MAGKLDEPMAHGCGKTFTYTQSYALHAKRCDGTKPATSGRIAARGGGERTPPARKRSTVRRERKATNAKPVARRKTVRNASSAVEAISPARMIAALDAEIAKLTKARDALRELA